MQVKLSEALEAYLRDSYIQVLGARDYDEDEFQEWLRQILAEAAAQVLTRKLSARIKATAKVQDVKEKGRQSKTDSDG